MIMCIPNGYIGILKTGKKAVEPHENPIIEANMIYFILFFSEPDILR